MIRAYLSALAENADLTTVLLFEHRSLDSQGFKRRAGNIQRSYIHFIVSPVTGETAV